ncbi:DUF4383 domain-containing protein [Candidatus Pacearchaeota archaeon]|nr:DUF4383 domain-containing protein [Candidatus Pacearchaeota archaeon]
MANVQKTFALVLGIVLLIIGLWGFFLPAQKGAILDLFGVNLFQSILHVIAGLFGIWVGIKGEGKGYNLSIGWIGIVLGVLGFIPGVDKMLMDLLNINQSITVLHLVIGIVSLLVAYAVKE